jgi:plasmid stabilization system protein ParE
MRINYVPEVADDLANAREWYENCSVGLGRDFVRMAYAGFSELQDCPEQHERVHGAFRRALLRRFPYGVYYQCSADSITVYGVFHTSRDPAVIKEAIGVR